MENQVSWVIELKVKPGQLETFKALMDEMVSGTSTEPQTLNYEWFISDDDSVVHIYEKYADSDAVLDHTGGFMEKWAGRFMEAVEPTRFTVYGNPTPACRELLDNFGGTYLRTWGGFAR